MRNMLFTSIVFDCSTRDFFFINNKVEEKSFSCEERKFIGHNYLRFIIISQGGTSLKFIE